MKKLLLFIFISLQICSAKSQVVFCPPGSVWQTIFTRSWPDQTLETETVTYVGKQFISPDSVKVLTHKRFFLHINIGSSITTYIKQNGDTIFMKNPRTQNNWQILYNFNTQPGHVWDNFLFIDQLPGSNLVHYMTTVLSNQTVTINGQNLKQLTVMQERSNSYTYTYTITERLGSSLFLFSNWGGAESDGDDFIENLCYTDSSFGIYHYSNKPCNYTTLLGINKNGISSDVFSLYPNPSTTNLNLIFEDQNTHNENYFFSITNSLGEKIKEGEISFQDTETRINIQNFAEGIYFVALRNVDNSNAEIINKRFVKTN